MTGRVSVIVPTFNAERSLTRCIRSLTDQTRALHQIIIIDDGSTDGSVGIAQSLALAHSMVEVHRQDNAGVSAARNRGLDLVTGDYVGFVDPDDFVQVEMYEGLVKAAMESGVPVVALRKHCIRSPLVVAGGRRGRALIGGEEAISGLLRLEYPSSVWAHLYLREAIGNTRFDCDVGFFEDLLFNFRVLMSVNKVLLLDSDYYNYRPGGAGANLADLNSVHLTAFIACARVRTIAEFEGRSLLPDLAVLEVHCLINTIYKAASTRKPYPQALGQIRSFTRSIAANSLVARHISARDKILVMGCLVSPGSIVELTRCAISLKRALPVRHGRSG